MALRRLIKHPSLIERTQREAANGHRAAVVWFTGLPGSGKSTLAHKVERQLFETGYQAFVLDGDNIRHGLSADLGFSAEHRDEHLRRVGELAKLLYDAGMIVLCAFVSPDRAHRSKVRELLPADVFFEVHCQCPADVCAQRDAKGFYAEAKAGKIADYTGVSAGYQEPANPELTLDTARTPVEECAIRVLRMLQKDGVIKTIAAAPDPQSAGRIRA